MRRAVVVALLFGCGINEVGEQVLDGSPAEAGDVVAIDVVKEAAPVVCNDAGVASCADAVAFRSPALFSPDAGAPCPAGYDSLDVVLSVPNAPTCGCNCTDAGAPSCDTTTVDYHTGAAGFCIGDGTVGTTRGVLLESPSAFASMMWLVAFAANTAQTSTTIAPRTQK